MATYGAMLMPRVLDVVRFGDFELDVRAYELRRNGQPVRLERRPMDLLIFLVERRGELVTRTDIVDQLWGKDVFIEVEPAVNTAVKKIRKALGDSPESPTYIETVAGKGYRFVAPLVTDTSQQVTPAPVDTSRFKGVGGVAAVVAMIASVAIGWQWRAGQAESASGPMRLVPLTTLAGMERGTTFSPDGRQVSFGWSGETEDNWDIYTKLIGSPEVRRLTTHPDRELAPKWSFDGRQIAYLRQEPGGEVEHLRVMSALGGSDRQISHLNVLPALSWSLDDRWIAVGVADRPGTPAGIYLLPVGGGAPRPLTRASPGGSDWMTAFSPDGRALAYGSCTDFIANCHVAVVALNAALEVDGAPRRLTTTPALTIRGLTWSRDGASVIYGAIRESSEDLWQVTIDGDKPPQRVEMAGSSALFPATTMSADRLAFTRGLVDEDVYVLDADGRDLAVARSSVFDGNAQFSPDGRKIAFCSDRTTDSTEIWIANADGSAAEQVTRGPGRFQCSPAWSPEGRSIAFESRNATGESQIYSIALNVRQPKPLTSGRGDRRMPSWSRNGQWIYFSLDEGTGRDIWRVRPAGGSPERVTRTGSGLAAAETADGTRLVYLGRRVPRLHEPTDAPLLVRPFSGGESRELIPCVRGTAFSVAELGLYYVPCGSTLGEARNPHVRFLDIATGTERSLGRLPGYENSMPSGFAASFDGRTFLYNRLISRGEDLILIENFR